MRDRRRIGLVKQFPNMYTSPHFVLLLEFHVERIAQRRVFAHLLYLMRTHVRPVTTLASPFADRPRDHQFRLHASPADNSQ